jgi:small-conductance mechanosensitive channel
MFLALASLWQDSFTFIARIWNQLTRQFTFGRITVSVSSVIVGVIVFTVTILIARTVSTFIEHRLAKRHHICVTRFAGSLDTW